MYCHVLFNWLDSGRVLKATNTSVPMAKRSKVSDLKAMGRWFDSRRRHFQFDFFVCWPFFTARWSPCKWNQAWSLTCSYCCFGTQIRLIIQGLYIFIATVYNLYDNYYIHCKLCNANKKAEMRIDLGGISVWKENWNNIISHGHKMEKKEWEQKYDVICHKKILSKSERYTDKNWMHYNDLKRLAVIDSIP